MDTLSETRWLGEQLKEFVHQGGVTLAELSRSLGHQTNYLTRAFRGRIPLKLQVIFEIPLSFRSDPWEMLRRLYPFGGNVALKARHRLAENAAAERLRRRMIETARELQADGHPGAAELTRRAGRVLIDLLRRRKVRQEKASRALGLGPKALGQALRGASSLTCHHLFGVLQLCESTPERFFLELFSRPEGDAVGTWAWARQLDLMEKGLPVMLDERPEVAAAARAQPRKPGKVQRQARPLRSRPGPASPA